MTLCVLAKSGAHDFFMFVRRLEAQLCEHATIKVGPHEEVSASSIKGWLCMSYL